MHRRSRQISTSSIDSNDDNSNNGSLIRRFSFSSIFAYFRQNSSPEFSTLNNITGIEDKNKSPQTDNTATNFSVKAFQNVEKF